MGIFSTLCLWYIDHNLCFSSHKCNFVLFVPPLLLLYFFSSAAYLFHGFMIPRILCHNFHVEHPSPLGALHCFQYSYCVNFHGQLLRVGCSGSSIHCVPKTGVGTDPGDICGPCSGVITPLPDIYPCCVHGSFHHNHICDILHGSLH